MSRIGWRLRLPDTVGRLYSYGIADRKWLLGIEVYQKNSFIRKVRMCQIDCLSVLPGFYFAYLPGQTLRRLPALREGFFHPQPGRQKHQQKNRGQHSHAQRPFFYHPSGFLNQIQIAFKYGFKPDALLVSNIRLAVNQNLHLADPRNLRKGIHNGIYWDLLQNIIALA